MWIVDSTTRAWQRIILREPCVWVELASASALLLMALWFALHINLRINLHFTHLMPLSILIGWTAVVGLVQGIAAFCFGWRMRATSDALAGIYWAGMSIQLGWMDGYTAVHPMLIVMAAFCALSVVRFFWGARRGS